MHKHHLNIGTNATRTNRCWLEPTQSLWTLISALHPLKEKVMHALHWSVEKWAKTQIQNSWQTPPAVPQCALKALVHALWGLLQDTSKEKSRWGMLCFLRNVLFWIMWQLRSSHDCMLWDIKMSPEKICKRWRDGYIWTPVNGEWLLWEHWTCCSRNMACIWLKALSNFWWDH